FIVEKMRDGMSPQQACEAICQRIIEINGGPEKINFTDKFVAVSKSGEVGCASIRGKKGEAPEAAFITEDGLKVVKAKYFVEIREEK
ncbi:MAG TPA: hypothetical protein VGA99_00570, partial [bacterium]